MAAKSRTVYICNECGYKSPKWMGKCPNCDEWNSFDEEVVVKSASASAKKAVLSTSNALAVTSINDVDENDEYRYLTGMSELDRVLGGGIVKGSLILLGGDPGIGKSTLLLQICQYLGQKLSVLYVSGEESQRQIKLRAKRLKVDTENLYLLTDTDISSVISTIMVEKPDVVIIDSIQTMSLDTLTSSAGSITQVRECTNLLMKCAKSEGVPIWVVGHVNKDGAIAGPKVLEHIVDAVLYFEGDRHQNYRIIRAVKNRFGSTNEIGVFDMVSTGLMEVENPSQMLLSGRPTNVSGTCVSCIMEGSRPILAEVQALVSKTGFGNPRRTATGFDYNRMAIIIAVLEKRVGYTFTNLDAYVNVIGGLRLTEPASDLSVAMALVSSVKDKAVGDHVISFGEVGLAGEIRSVNNTENRIREAMRLGFTRCIIPHSSLAKLNCNAFGEMEIIGVRSINEAVKLI